MKQLWVGRIKDPKYNEGPGAVCYEVGLRKKSWCPFSGFQMGKGWSIRLCLDEFEAITGIHLEPGEIRKCKLVLED